MTPQNERRSSAPAAPSFAERIQAVKGRARIVEVARRYVGDLRQKQRGDWWGCSPFVSEKTPSFHVVEEGAGGGAVKGGGIFHCFSTGEHGDVIGLVQKCDGVSFIQALERLEEDLGLSVEADADGRAARARERRRLEAAEREAERRRRADARVQAEEAEARARARDLYGQGLHAAGTPVESYLRGRGIDLDLIGGVPADLRYLAEHRHTETGRVCAVMLAPFRAADGAIVAVHRTFLVPDSRCPDLWIKLKAPAAKKMSRGWRGAAIRLIAPFSTPIGADWRAATPPPPGWSEDAPNFLADPSPGCGLVSVAEGIENALAFAVLQRLRDPACVLGWVAAAGARDALCGGGLGEGRVHPNPDPERVVKGRRPPRLPPRAFDPARPGMLIPAFARTVRLLADSDGKDPLTGETLMKRALDRWAGGYGLADAPEEDAARRGLKRPAVHLHSPPAGLDWNDVLVRVNREIAARVAASERGRA